MKSNKVCSVFFCFSLIVLIILSFPGYGKSGFPSYNNLKERNVSLEMMGFAFASGLNLNQQGKPNGIGDELLQISWCGSGFIVGSNGTILTNYHVARRALQGRAIFEDGSSFEIKHIKVYDPISDLAVLKIKADKKFPTVKLGNSDKTKVMEKVLAVGNTLCEKLAVTEGMINQIKSDDNDVRLQFRHSAAIAPGNSGGALYVGKEVIAVNVATRPPYEIHYAIPINLAKGLLKYERVILFKDAFPTSYKSILKKTKQLYSKNGQVPAGSAGKSGSYLIKTKFYPLEDLIVFLQAQKNRDLVLTITNSQGNLIGYGDLRGVDYDIILISSDYYQDAYISVMNYDDTPANFAIAIYQIAW